MGRLVVTEFMTLDGVMEAPGFEEHRDGKNTWALSTTTEDQQRFKVDELFAAGAILLGRVTYQIWATFWPDAPKEAGLADRINALEKYVVSTILREPTWNNTKVIRSDLAGEVRGLKERSDGDVLVFGSAELVDSLLELDLVDELRIMLFPIVLGSGKRLFRDERDVSHFRLVGTRAFDSGVVLLTYEPSTEAPSSPYVESFAWTDEQIASWEAGQDADRVLASILFTDVVDSTGRAAALGDRRWRQLIDRHDRVVRAEIDRFHGRLIKTTGDGVLATFDAPTRALRCAFAMIGSLDEAGSASAPRSTPGRSSWAMETWVGSASTSPLGCWPRRGSARSWSLEPFATWRRAPTCPSHPWGPPASAGCRASGSSSASTTKGA
jgi:dihydrofolate reductase